MLATSFHSVVAITSPLHGEDPQFDPEWKHFRRRNSTFGTWITSPILHWTNMFFIFSLMKVNNYVICYVLNNIFLKHTWTAIQKKKNNKNQFHSFFFYNGFHNLLWTMEAYENLNTSVDKYVDAMYTCSTLYTSLVQHIQYCYNILRDIFCFPLFQRVKMIMGSVQYELRLYNCS